MLRGVRSPCAPSTTATLRRRRDAGNAATINIDTYCACRKCLCHRHFLNRCFFTRDAADMTARLTARAENAAHGRRSAISGNKKNFVGKPHRGIPARRNDRFRTNRGRPIRWRDNPEAMIEGASREPRTPLRTAKSARGDHPRARARGVRGRASTSGDRSRPAGLPCRRTTSSPVRRTSRSSAASLSPVQPCPDWRRRCRRLPSRSHPGR
jgi:hypothetical protein